MDSPDWSSVQRLTADPKEFGLPTFTAPEIPHLEWDRKPVAVRRDCGEPLVQVEHRKVVDVSAYSKARLPGAIPHAMLRAGVVEKLHEAAAVLPDRMGFAVLDGWRPFPLQQYLHDRAADMGKGNYVATPSTGAIPSPHTTGGAIDITLTWDDIPLGLGSPYDALDDRAHTRHFEQTARGDTYRNLRRLLFWSLADKGFVVNELEWWHFEFGTARWAQLKGRDDPRYGFAGTARSLAASH